MAAASASRRSVRRGLLALVALYAAYFLLVPAAGVWLLGQELGPSLELAAALLLGQAILIIVTIVFMPWRQWRSVLGWRRVPLRWGRMVGAAAVYVAASFALGLLSLVLMSRLGLPLESARQEVLESIFQAHDLVIVWLTPLALAIIAPLGEELFFRGLVYGLLRPAGRGWATGVTAVAFALLHLEPAAFLGHLGFGLYLASLRERTGSVWPSVVTHGAANLLLYILTHSAGQFV